MLFILKSKRYTQHSLSDGRSVCWYDCPYNTINMS